MQNVTADFRNAIHAGGAKYLRLTFSDGELTQQQVCSFTYDSAVNPDTDLTIGATNCAALKLQCHNNGITMDLNNKAFTAELGAMVNDAVEYCLLGTFISQQPSSTIGETLEIVAYDKMALFDTDATAFLHGLTYPITAKQLFAQLCTHVGVTASTADFINCTKSVTALSLAGATCRDILGWIAELACAWARMSRDDVCELVWLNPVEYQLDRSQYTTRVAAEYAVLPIDKLQVHVTQDDIGVIVGTGSNAYAVLDNPLLYGAADAEIRPWTEAIYARLAAVASYVPCSVSAVGDPSLEPGDVITVGCFKFDMLIDANGKNVLDADGLQILMRYGSIYTGDITLPIYSLHFDWNGALTAEYVSTGTESRQPMSATNRRVLRSGASYAELKATVEEVSSAVFDDRGNSLIQQNANRISLVVDDNGDIDAASIVLAINDAGSEVKISADHVNITGLVTFSNLSTAGQTQINGGNITAGTIAAARIDVDNLNVKKLDSATGSFVELESSNGSLKVSNTGVYIGGGNRFYTYNGGLQLSAEFLQTNCTIGCIGLSSSGPNRLTSVSQSGGGNMYLAWNMSTGEVLYSTPSSIRYKHNVNPILDEEYDIMQFEPVSFRFDFDDQRKNYGLIAEAAAANCPTLAVTQMVNGQEVIEGLDYMQLIPICIKEIQKIWRVVNGAS